MKLQDRLNALKAELAIKVSPEARNIIHRSTEQLKSSELALQALQVDQKAPVFALPSATGALLRSTDWLLRGPLVISFYRGLWCPYCNLELEALQEVLMDIRARGSELVVISPQTAANNRRSARVASLDYPLLTDRGNGVARDFGLRFSLPSELIALYRTLGNNLELFNGDDSWTLPMPARFVIDSGGIVRYAEVNPDYTERPDPRDLLPVLDSLSALSEAMHVERSDLRHEAASSTPLLPIPTPESRAVASCCERAISAEDS